MRRVCLHGNSGAGKTTLGRSLASAMNVPFLELDSLYHQADWTPLPSEEFRHRVGEFVAGDAWVVDGNYTSELGRLVLDRADTLVYVDPGRVRCTWRIVRRTLRRLTGPPAARELWNGNRESWASVLSRDPRRNIVLWSITRAGHYRRRWEAIVADPANAHLRTITVRTAADRRRLLAAP